MSEHTAEKDAGFLTQADKRHIAGWWDDGEEVKHRADVVQDIIAREVAKAQAPADLVRDMFSDERWLGMSSLHLYQIRRRVLDALDTRVIPPGSSAS